jgi:hypothetical protein
MPGMSLEFTPDQISEVESRFSNRAQEYRKVFQKHYLLFEGAELLRKELWAQPQCNINENTACMDHGRKVREAVGEIMEVILNDKHSRNLRNRYVSTGTAWDKKDDGTFYESEYQPYIDMKTGELCMSPCKRNILGRLQPVIDKKRPRTDAECVYVGLITNIFDDLGFSREEYSFIRDGDYPRRVLIHEEYQRK